MNPLNWLDGKKTILGVVLTQLPIWGQSNVGNALWAAGVAIWYGSPGGWIEPTCYAAAQVLLVVGATHKILKTVSQPTSPYLDRSGPYGKGASRGE